MGHLTNVANSVVQSLEKGKNKAALETIFTGESLSSYVINRTLTLHEIKANSKHLR